jgi:hypothetical protein
MIPRSESEEFSRSAVLILALERAKNRLKPELQTGWAWIGRGSEFRLQAVGRQNENGCLEIVRDSRGWPVL